MLPFDGVRQKPRELIPTPFVFACQQGRGSAVQFMGGIPTLARHLNQADGFPRLPALVPTDFMRFTERTGTPLSLVDLPDDYPARLFAISSLTAGTSSLGIPMIV